jgi:hypothetical protein
MPLPVVEEQVAVADHKVEVDMAVELVRAPALP